MGNQRRVGATSAFATYDMTGSTAFVTGAAGDIGRAVALRLAASGARLGLTDLDAAGARLEETRELCIAEAGSDVAQAVTADVTDPENVEACVAQIAAAYGAPNLVFNNAGYQGDFTATPDYSNEDFARVMRINVDGAFHVLATCARRLRADGMQGSIVNTASMAGVDGAPNMVAYSASKGALIAMTLSAAKDLAPLGIRVNAISPAFIGPGMMWDRQVELQARADSRYFSTDPAVVAEQMIGQVPMARYGSLDEVAAAAVWLLSEESSYVTGQNIRITGGL